METVKLTKVQATEFDRILRDFLLKQREDLMMFILEVDEMQCYDQVQMDAKEKALNRLRTSLIELESELYQDK